MAYIWQRLSAWFNFHNLFHYFNRWNLHLKPQFLSQKEHLNKSINKHNHLWTIWWSFCGEKITQISSWLSKACLILLCTSRSNWTLKHLKTRYVPNQITQKKPVTILATAMIFSRSGTGYFVSNFPMIWFPTKSVCLNCQKKEPSLQCFIEFWISTAWLKIS